MSEIKIFYKDKEKIKVARSISALRELDKKDIIWIDLLDVSDKTEDTLEGFLKTTGPVSCRGLHRKSAPAP